MCSNVCALIINSEAFRIASSARGRILKYANRPHFMAFYIEDLSLTKSSPSVIDVVSYWRKFFQLRFIASYSY
jgi:hypothetical protein